MRLYRRCMATLTSSSRAASPPIVNTVVTAAILAAFTVFSLWVVHGYGYTGFLSLAAREPWALQMLIDLALALVIAVRWLRADARARGIVAWPYVVIAVFLGSIGILLYVVRRALPIRRPGT